VRVCGGFSVGKADGERGVSADVLEVGCAIDFMYGIVDFFLKISV